jgi:hypothetical protein
MLRSFLRTARSRRVALDGLVEQIALASVDAAWKTSVDRVAGMSPPEARGYIHGRSVCEVRRRARQVVMNRPEFAPEWETIALRAADRVASLVLRRLSAVTPRVRLAPGRAA